MQTLLKELNQIQAVADQQRELNKLMAVLKALKAGEISLDNLTIDGDNWKVAEVAESVPVPDSAPISAPIINSPAREAAAKAAAAPAVEKTEPEPAATE